jgi:uncharacterized protein
MLLSFRFANHRSFRDEQQLNLLPVYETEAEAKLHGLPSRVVGIFGANASGKSNCLGALTFMRRFATSSDREVEPGQEIVTDPFRLDPACADEPSRYVVDLLLGNVRHTYGFSIDRNAVLEEWLTWYPKNRPARVFERQGTSFIWGDSAGRRADLDQISGITSPTALYLSTSARFRLHDAPGTDLDPLAATYQWFSRFRDRRVGTRSLTSMQTLLERSENRKIIIDLLRASDVGIVDIELVHLPNFELDQVLVADLAETNLQALKRSVPTSKRRIRLSHQGFDGPVFFELNEESTGTRQLFDLAIDASFVLRSRGTLTIDEIDASLHPMLTAQLIRLFQNPTTNPAGSQLIFTSHDAALLGRFDGDEVLHRDQIWFTEKDDTGASALYPLSDFRPRKSGENRQRRYLNGNYGGVPDLSTDLFEQALFARRTREADA